jgi:hypothetical protein
MQAQACIYGSLSRFTAPRAPPQVLLHGNTLPVLYQGHRAVMMPPDGTRTQLFSNPFEVLPTCPHMGWTQQLLSAAAAGDSAAVASALAAGTSVNATGGYMCCLQPVVVP